MLDLMLQTSNKVLHTYASHCVSIEFVFLLLGMNTFLSLARMLRVACCVSIKLKVFSKIIHFSSAF